MENCTRYIFDSNINIKIPDFCECSLSCVFLNLKSTLLKLHIRANRISVGLYTQLCTVASLILRSKLHSFTVFFPNQIYFRDKYKIIDIRKLCQKNGLVVSSEEHQINQITVAMRV